MKKALSLALLLFFSTVVNAYDFLEGGIYYNINDGDSTVSVTFGETRTDVEGWVYIIGQYSGNVTVPSQVYHDGKTYVVTEIGNSAFSECGSLSRVTIPGTVTRIGNNAFCESAIRCVNIPESVTEIGRGAFYKCSFLYSIDLPENLTEISDHLFECSGIKSINIRPSITRIGSYAFWSSDLTSIYIPASVTSIGSEAFSFCTHLAAIEVNEDNPNYDSRGNCNAIIRTESNCLLTACDKTVIPDGILTIANHAFDNCNGITSVVIPASVNDIGSWAFAYCGSLTEVICKAMTPPQTAKQFSFSNYDKTTLFVPVDAVEAYRADEYWSLFSSIVGINSVNKFQNDGIWYVLTSDSTVMATNVDDHNETVTYSGDIVIPHTVSFEDIEYRVTALNNYMFKDNKQLTGIDLRCDIEEIPLHAFKNCTALASVTIPDQVKIICHCAFENCESLAEVRLPSALTELRNYAFSNCKGLTGIDLPENLTYIGLETFSGCTGLTSLYIPSKVSRIDEQAFDGCKGLTSMKVSPYNSKYDSRGDCNAIIEKSSNDLLFGCMNTVIPEGIRWITSYAFHNCVGLKSIVIPNSVSRISLRSFDGCSNLETVTIGNGVEKIMDYAFDNCRSLCVLDIPSNVTYMANNAFAYCSSLKQVNLPSTIGYLNEKLFYGCSSLTTVTLPESVHTIRSKAFGACTSLDTVICCAKTPPTSYNDSFSDKGNLTLCVPQVSLENYKTATYWKDFGNIIPIGYHEPADVNGDNVVNLTDVNIVINVIIGGRYDSNADVNSDGNVTIADINAIIAAILNP